MNNYHKLCRAVSDEPKFHKHMSEYFRIYSDLNKLNLVKRFLTEAEILSVKELCTRFGKFIIHFQNESVTRKTHKLMFDVYTPSRISTNGGRAGGGIPPTTHTTQKIGLSHHVPPLLCPKNVVIIFMQFLTILPKMPHPPPPSPKKIL